MEPRQEMYFKYKKVYGRLFWIKPLTIIVLSSTVVKLLKIYLMCALGSNIILIHHFQVYMKISLY